MEMKRKSRNANRRRGGAPRSHVYVRSPLFAVFLLRPARPVDGYGDLLASGIAAGVAGSPVAENN